MTTYSFRLFDLSGNLFENEFRDDRNQIAYIIRPTPQPKLGFAFPELPSPIEIVRQSDWGIALEHEPWRAVFTLLDTETIQSVQIGQQQEVLVEDMLRRDEEPNKRVFLGLDGQEYCWKPASRRLECFDSNDGVLAVYEYLVDDPSYAKLDVKPLGWAMTTEIITTLILARYDIRRS
ncbi:hypothetical protein FRB90_011232 [Tulasnella sp. 427]|nr:hypothetical protein FRB90_011232 [Tulasnella sp. 427]